MAALTVYLADTSAWHRATHSTVAAAWEYQLATDSLATCTQVRLEILYSARSAADYGQLNAELLALRQLPCGEDQFERALEVQHKLAGAGDSTTAASRFRTSSSPRPPKRPERSSGTTTRTTTGSPK